MIEVYQDRMGTWCCHALGSFSDGFPTREAALDWAISQMTPELVRLYETEAEMEAARQQQASGGAG